MELGAEEQATLVTYQRIAATWAERNGDVEYWREQFSAFHGLLPSGRILDVGCGAGRDAEFFLEAGSYNYIGIDISTALLNVAKQHFPQVTFQEMSMYELDFPDHSFDGFWAAASLLHIPKESLFNVLTEIARVVKPGGVGFIAVKNGEGESMVVDSGTNTERFFAFYRDEEFRNYLPSEFEILHYEHLIHPKDQKDWLLYLVRRR